MKRTPLLVWRAAMATAAAPRDGADEAMEMTDNAAALPKPPQQQKPTTSLAA